MNFQKFLFLIVLIFIMQAHGIKMIQIYYQKKLINIYQNLKKF